MSLAECKEMLGFSGNPVNRCENPFTKRKGLKFRDFLVAIATTVGLSAPPRQVRAAPRGISDDGTRRQDGPRRFPRLAVPHSADRYASGRGAPLARHAPARERCIGP